MTARQRRGPAAPACRDAALAAFLTLLCISCAGSPEPGTMIEPGQWSGGSTVATRYGLVQGFEDAEETWVWKAIPYARPPVGDLRWRAPRDPVPWSGVRSSRSFNAGCTQLNPVFPGSIVGSEDCLYLNVWRPRTADARLPVFVWIHGGGNSEGSATMVPDYYGDRIASRDRVLFVSLNYRLGPFGWFTHPTLRDGASPEDASGNYGTLDIIQALGWIRGNIEVFGGDPGNVTIAGESAGGFDVLSLLISPPAKGLFQKAMSESGIAHTSGMDEADAMSARVLSTLLVKDGRAADRTAAEAAAEGMSPREIRAYLRSKTDRQILGCYAPWSFGMIDNPTILRDGAVIPAEGFGALADGSYPNKVPAILGSNKEEMKLFVAFSGSIPWESDLAKAIVRFGSARWKASGVDEVAARLAANADQPPVYAYLFAWGSPGANGASVLPGSWGQRLGAFHSLEIPFFLGTDTVDGVFQHVLFTRKNQPGRQALSSAMMAYLGGFLRSGDPNACASGLPAWPRWTNEPGAAKCIVFDASDEAAVITTTGEQLSDDEVVASITSSLPEPLAAQTRDYFAQLKIPMGVR